VVRADVESEFIDSNHTNCLLLRQLFKQAEKWHLKLNVDTSELENKGLLDEVAKLEDTSMSSTSLRNESKGKLIPLEESGTDILHYHFLLYHHFFSEVLKLKLHFCSGTASNY